MFADGSRDEYEFRGTPGATVTITVDTTSPVTTFDPTYGVFHDAGQVNLFVVRNDDFVCSFPPPAGSCPTATFALPADADGK